jgi:uncharacterized protein (DUF302 family)
MRVNKPTTLVLTLLSLVAFVLPAQCNGADEETVVEDPSFYLETTLALPWDDARAKVEAALVEQKFAVLTEIDLQAKFKEKLDVDIPRYVLLGACGAGFAHKAWEINPHVGILLPCTVVLRENEAGDVHVLMRDPRGLAQFDDELALIGEEVYGKMQAVIAALEG